MSWATYVDNCTACPAITKAAIIGLNGAIWTPPGNANTMNISQPEASTIGPIMAKKDGKSVFAEKGVTVEGVRYMFLRDLDDDGKIITAKKAGLGNIVLQSSVQAVVIAFVPEAQNHLAGSANAAVDKLAKYLEGLGY